MALFLYVSVISIHAPTGGATSAFVLSYTRPSISIHAPTGGATLYLAYHVTSGGFQSTLPRGERQYLYLSKNLSVEISIHAPTGGATYINSCSNSTKSYFNPRSHGGSDCPLSISSRSTSYFNPRSHGGSDDLWHDFLKNIKISIHAPTGGATYDPLSTL